MIDEVYHFASPNDTYEFGNKQNMAYMMIDFSIDILKQSISNNAKFIFASSYAVHQLDDDYGVYKKSFEQYIQAKTDNYLIYRIPRVYGSKRKKGLMKQLRRGDVSDNDMDVCVSYIDISDFKQWFLVNLDKTGIISYNKEFRKNTLREIQKIYL